MKSGWQIKMLGEICDIALGKTPQRGNPHYWDKSGNPKNVWLSIADMHCQHGGCVFDSAEYISDQAIAETGIRRVLAGTLLVSFKLTLGRCAVAGIDLFTNEAIAALTIKPLYTDKISNEFLRCYFSFFDWNDFAAKDEKVKGKTLNKGKLKGLPVIVPPVPEQQKILDFVGASFEKIDAVQRNAERNLANAKELFQRVLDEEMTPKDGWSVAPLKDLTTDLGDGIHGTPLYDPSGDYYFINGNNLEQGKIIFREKTKRVSNSEAKKNILNLTEKTVLVSINGTLGRVAFYRGEKIILGKSACYFTLKDSIEIRYAYYIFSSDIFLRYAKKVATGATINNVSLKSMREFKIYYPSITTQREIVKHIATFEKTLSMFEKKCLQTMSKCAELKQQILSQAFNGDL